MKVLFVSAGDCKYGAAKSMMTMIEILKEKCDVEPILLTKKKNILNDYCTQHGIENYSIWYRDIMAGSPYSSKFMTILKHVVKYLLFLLGGLTKRRVNKLPIDFSTIDIVHSNLNRQDIGAYIASKYNLRHVWHVREMGKADYNVIFYKRNCISYMNKYSDAFIFISNVVHAEWGKLGLDVSKGYVMYDGMETENIKKRIERNDDVVRVVMTGRIQPNKGQFQLVKSIAKLSPDIRDRIRVDIMGEAYQDYKREIEAFIKKHGLQEYVHLVGYRDNINQILSEYDIGVTCSKAEAFGRVTVEYMIAGLLTIASDTGANLEIIENGKTGMLYEYENVDNLSDILKWAVTHSEERKVMAEAGCQTAKLRYSKEQYANKIFEVYQNVL